ncbi:MAG: VCBS repeat-containing protein [Planctomycetes bacterium]|nr:VCBS repeat-containing protein [Planctomycetota bacterium]
MLALIGTSFAMGSFSRRAAAQGPLFPAQQFPAGASFPFTVAIGDLNLDGKNDVVSASSANPTVMVNMGDGFGFLGQPTIFTLAAGASAFSLILSDLNNDGFPDIVVSASNNQVQLLLGNGFGGFAPAAGFNTASNPYAVVAGDFNNDGKIDLATANNGSGSASCLLGNGAGGFANAVNSAAGSLPYAIAAADFDHDGRLDVVIANNNNLGTVSILRGTGHGTFLAPSTHATGSNPHSVATLDINNDNSADIVASNVISNTVTVLYNNGSGSFGSSDFAAGDYPSWLTTADFNLDGRIDCAVANEFVNTVSLLATADPAGNFAPPVSFPVGGAPAIVTSGDLNQDGLADIATGHVNGDSRITVLLNNTKGFVGASKIAVGSYPFNVAVGDLNHDGNNDFVTSNYTGVFTGTMSVALAQPPGNFGVPTNYPTGAGPQWVALADLDGDRNLDAVTANSNAGNINIFKGNSTGGFEPPSTIAVGAYPRYVAIADLNHDGRPDLATANYGAANLSILLQNTAGGFASPVNITLAVQSGPIGIDAGDLNGDGDADLVVAQSGKANLVLLFGFGDGTFTSASLVPVGTYPGSVEITDVNRDGKADLVAACSDGAHVALGNGTGTFGASTGIGSPFDARAAATGDCNLDGSVDLAVADGLGSVSVYSGNGAGTFTIIGSYADTTSPYSIAIADMNADGADDLLTANYNSDEVFILYNRTTAPYGAASFGSGTPGCRGFQCTSANSTPKVNNPDFGFTCTNSPRLALGLGIAADAGFYYGSPDPFGLGITMEVDLLGASQIYAFDAVSDAAGTSFVAVAIPADPGLAGAVFYYQTIFLEDSPNGARCGATTMGVVSSNGLLIVIQP